MRSITARGMAKLMRLEARANARGLKLSCARPEAIRLAQEAAERDGFHPGLKPIPHTTFEEAMRLAMHCPHIADIVLNTELVKLYMTPIPDNVLEAAKAKRPK